MIWNNKWIFFFFKREGNWNKKKRGGWQSDWKYVTAYIKYHIAIYSIHQKDPTWPISLSPANHLTSENTDRPKILLLKGIWILWLVNYIFWDNKLLHHCYPPKSCRIITVCINSLATRPMRFMVIKHFYFVAVYLHLKDAVSLMIIARTEGNKKGDCGMWFRCINSEINLIQKQKPQNFLLPVQINYKLNNSSFLVLSYEKTTSFWKNKGRIGR